MDNASSIAKSLENRRTNKAIEHLLGLIRGIVADQHLHVLEVQLLSTWLSAYPEATGVWPGNLVAEKMRAVLDDGVITEAERAHLLTVLTGLIGHSFQETGSVSPEVASLPINDVVTVDLRNAGVCLTGNFIYGTRAACERLTLRAGGMPLDDVSKKVDILVVGSLVSPDWAYTTFGKKIQKAKDLQGAGHPIEIISEQRWMEALSQESA